jgi:hypothetical protein
MPIKLHHSLSRAHKVLRAVNAMKLPTVIGRRFEAQSWDGCREQGLVLSAILLPPKTEAGPRIRKVGIFIAEARSSDSTIVVVDDGFEGRPDNKPSIRAWDNGTRYFSPGDIDGAAAFVAKTLRSFIERFDTEEK